MKYAYTRYTAERYKKNLWYYLSSHCVRNKVSRYVVLTVYLFDRLLVSSHHRQAGS